MVEYGEDVRLKTMHAADLAEKVLAWHEARENLTGRRKKAALMLTDPLGALRPAHEALGLRSRAVSILTAYEARTDPDVESFRKDQLRGKVIRWDDLEVWIKKRTQAEGAGDGERLLPYVTGDERWVRHVPVARGGVLDRLKSVAQSVAQRYRWSELQAIIFMLTDLPPIVDPLKWDADINADIPGLSRIVLTIDPATPPAAVEAAYQAARSGLLPGKRHRDIDAQRTTLAAWAALRADESAEQRMRAWNAQYPKWKYSDLAYFVRDIKQAQRRLLRPGYHTDDLTRLSGGSLDMEKRK